jgi:thiol:disulfide interchange protein
VPGKYALRAAHGLMTLHDKHRLLTASLVMSHERSNAPASAALACCVLLLLLLFMPCVLPLPQ